MRSPDPRQAARVDVEHRALKTPALLWQHPLAYLLGLEGVALLRAFAGEHGREFVGARLAEIRGLLASADRLGEGTLMSPMPVVDGGNDLGAPLDDHAFPAILGMDRAGRIGRHVHPGATAGGEGEPRLAPCAPDGPGRSAVRPHGRS